MTQIPGKCKLPGTINKMFRKCRPIMGCFPGIWKKRKTRKPSSAFPRVLLSLNVQNLTTVVGTASLASSVGHYGLTALGANRNAGSGQLPVGATALIAAGLGHFTLRNSHGDTSLVKLLFTAFILDLLLKKLL